MARIAGVEIPSEKRLDIGLTYIYGMDGSTRVKDLSEEQIGRIQKTLEGYVVEGDLQRQVMQNIRRMEDIGSYRGLRHRRGLPVRGQRTRSNARSRRGKRKTVGTVRKEVVAKSQPKS